MKFPPATRRLGPEETRGEYGELRQDVMRDIEDSGLDYGPRDVGESQDDGEKNVFFVADQARQGYVARAASLVGRIWPQPKLPYAVLSAVAHGELFGLQRNLAVSPTGLVVGPDEATSLWMWQDSYLVIGALMFTADRAATFLGLTEQLAKLQELVSELDERLTALRPGCLDVASDTG